MSILVFGCGRELKECWSRLRMCVCCVYIKGKKKNQNYMNGILCIVQSLVKEEHQGI